MTPWHHAGGTEVRWFEHLGSSNDAAREWALSDYGTRAGVVWAESQSAGRGRRGNAWLCPAGEGLAVSYWLRPQISRSDWGLLALLAAVAIADTLAEDYSLMAGIKWPNDVWIDGKKIAGILVEIVDDMVIVGMGINVNVSSFPPPLDRSSTSLYLQTGLSADRREFLENMITRIERMLCGMTDGGSAIIEMARCRCVLQGRRVRLLSLGAERCVDVIGIGERGELWILDEGKPEALWQADEIRPLS
jgi:BirA family biotin operon repressor/biotin-[acetyl-CoA-carboxylase] ligase